MEAPVPTRSNGFIVLGAIEQKWLSLGGERGALGKARSNEERLGNSPAQIQLFERAWICWHPELGAKIIKGAIATRWEQLGRERFGFPSTDEMPAVRGGFFNHFVLFTPSGRAERSIYWQRETGANEVIDQIRKKWAEKGWDQGALGFPRGPEVTLDDRKGKLQLFENAWICWHPSVGAHIIKGAIASRWEALGRNNFGYPSTDEMPAIRGGCFNHFLFFGLRGTRERSIYWHRDTGAHEVRDEIRKKWAATGWDQGLLGFPKGPELTLDDGVGKLQLFENAWICWHPETKAQIMRGAIATRWEQLGRNHFGYPITDEMPAIDGGHFNHFLALTRPGRPERSIYSHPKAGTFEVIDEIRRKWAEHGWDQGVLGYPVGTEESGPEETRRQRFQGGQISWRADRGAGVDYITKRKIITTPSGTALGGWVELEVHWNGDYVFRGHMHGSGLVGYHFQVQATLSLSSTVILMRKTGQVDGTVSRDVDRDFDWEDRGNSKQLAELWPEPIMAEFHIAKAYEISSPISSIVDAIKEALAFAIGIQVLGPHVALAILLGHELGQKTDLRLLGAGGFPSIVVTSGWSFLMGPGFAIPVFIGANLAHAAIYDGRRMTDEEYAFARTVFGDSLPPPERIILSNMSGLGGRAFVAPNGDGSFLVNMGEDPMAHPGGPREYFQPPRSDGRDPPYPERGQLLIHELVHVWQLTHTNFAPVLICSAITNQITKDNQTYKRPADSSKPWNDLNPESQGSIVDKWFAEYSKDWANIEDLDEKLRSTDATTDRYYHYIAKNIRMAIFHG